jgi:tRNA modification GTPase
VLLDDDKNTAIKSVTDTIAAIATPPGRGGVGIVRVSGPHAKAIAEKILGTCPSPREAKFSPFKDADSSAIDYGIALYFKAPHSYTGEDVLELQGHGGPVVMDLLLQRTLSLGARLARPGEFSERAFLNDKLDLAQAEAIADLIDASSTQAARSALRSLEGEFSARIRSLVEQLTEARIYVEAAIDFPEEEIDFLQDSDLSQRIDGIVNEMHAVTTAARQGSLLREGMHVVIAGQPNAGKSSLLNCLAGREAAIVTDIPGTTRDVLRQEIVIDGLPLHIIDTAGLRESEDVVEKIGIARAWDEINRADRVLLVVDARQGVTPADRDILARLPQRLPLTVIYNKVDLIGAAPSERQAEFGVEISLSALSGTGIGLLRQHLKESIGYQASEGSFIARRRHLDALQRADAHIETARTQLQQRAGELLAEELRQAQQALSEITGEFSSDDLLGRIFSSFCVGK